jgi:hypothetical protein
MVVRVLKEQKMVSKGIIGFLSLCLVIAIGLFLYTGSSSDDPAAPNSISLSKKASTPQQTATAAEAKTPLAQADKQSEKQPDKFLPIPTHQLKKLLVGEDATAKNDTDKALQEKIKAASQAIAEIEQQMPASVKQPAPSTAVATENKQTQQRLEYLRGHIEKLQFQ